MDLPIESVLERARLGLSRVALRDASEIASALHQATRVISETLDTDRVGVWTLSGTQLLCLHQYVRSTETHSQGQAIDCATTPCYLRAIHQRRVICADDARTHPATAELAESYLVPLGISSMLDAPIFQNGQVIGVVCLEHVGPARAWGQRAVDFACSVADIVATLFEQEARLEAEAILRGVEAERARSARMESLVRMGAGVAHDFKNVLQTIALSGEMLACEPARAPEVIRLLAEEVRRGKAMLDELLAFCRAQSFTSTPIDIVAVAVAAEPSLRMLVRPPCSLVMELPRREILITANAHQVVRVLTNLIINARDAMMPHGGTTTLRISKLLDPSGRDHALVEVRDEGLGMDDATRERVFEPFFTTKERSGTGLGLPAVLGIVEQSGGRISVESAPGEGTVFRIFWPFRSAA